MPRMDVTEMAFVKLYPLMRDIRCLDKLIDELAKGKTMEKILRRQVSDDE